MVLESQSIVLDSGTMSLFYVRQGNLDLHNESFKFLLSIPFSCKTDRQV